MDIDAGPKVMGDDGQFHAADEVVDLSGTPVEAWVALALCWALGLTVFYQFFTRYVLNNSASWTEEIARYLLIGTVFVGATIGVAKNNHIQVDFFYRFMPRPLSRAMGLLVDVMRIVFFGLAGLALAAALVVVLARDVFRSAIALTGVLVVVAGVFAMLNADFVAASQLLVYVGGVLV